MLYTDYTFSALAGTASTPTCWHEYNSLHFFLAIAIRTAIINISTRNMRAFSNTSRMNNDVEMPPWLPPPPLYVCDRRIEGRIRKNLYIQSAQRHTNTQSVTREMAVWA